MKNITLSADEHLIEEARMKAQQKKTTLNAEFRNWLAAYTHNNASKNLRISTYRDLMSEFSNISTGGKSFSRDEMNER
jgi:hypothetical protein